MQNFFHLLYLYKRYSYLHYQQEEMYVNQKEKVLRRYGERRTISLAQDITYGKVLSHYNFSFSLVNTFFKMHPCIQIVDCYVEGFFSCVVFIFNASKSFTVNLNKLICLLLSPPFSVTLSDISIFLLNALTLCCYLLPLLLFSLKGFLFAPDVPTVLLSTTAQF